MAFEAANPRLFGLDLGRVARAFRQGWEGALRWPASAWLSPRQPVQVIWPDGSLRVCAGASLDAADRHSSRPVFRAQVLPDDIVLSHSVRLPQLSNSEIEQALQLQLEALSPFPPDRLAWGWRVDEVDDAGLTITLAFAARTHVDDFLARHAAGGQVAPAEVWADTGGAVVLKGFGEGRRESALHAQRRNILLLLGVTLLLVAALSASHFWQLRARVFDAEAQFATLQAEAGPYMEARSTLVHATEKARAIGAYLDAQPDLPWLLESLTGLLPDSAWISRLDVDGRRVRITGQADDAAALMEVLRARPEFSGLRALSPITRGRDGRDNFSLEFVVAAPQGAR